MDPKHTALVLIGYQNDYFAADGVLHQVIKESFRVTGILANTIDLLERLHSTPLLKAIICLSCIQADVCAGWLGCQ